MWGINGSLFIYICVHIDNNVLGHQSMEYTSLTLPGFYCNYNNLAYVSWLVYYIRYTVVAVVMSKGKKLFNKKIKVMCTCFKMSFLGVLPFHIEAWDKVCNNLNFYQNVAYCICFCQMTLEICRGLMYTLCPEFIIYNWKI